MNNLRVKMCKKILALVIAGYGLLIINSYAQAEEQITITTYYPSPYGSYNNLDTNNLQADRIAVGNGTDPTVVGDGVIDFIPLTTAPVGNAGSIYYNANLNIFMYHNGTSWQSITPSPAQLVYYGTTADVYCVPSGTHVVAVLDSNKRGASMASPPQAGYMVCH